MRIEYECAHQARISCTLQKIYKNVIGRVKGKFNENQSRQNIQIIQLISLHIQKNCLDRVKKVIML
jgi:hypothetical protein